MVEGPLFGERGLPTAEGSVKLERQKVSGPSVFTRANYMKVLGSYTLAGANSIPV
jgi:hypothetical protein